MATHFLLESPIGVLTLVKTNGLLSGLYMGMSSEPGVGLGPRSNSGFEDVVEQLQEYFAQSQTTFTIPTSLEGTSFQKRVWAELMNIPYGETRSYGQLADAIGNRSAVRAVGAANGGIPSASSSRAIASLAATERWSGMGAALERKRFLLELEQAAKPAQQGLFSA